MSKKQITDIFPEILRYEDCLLSQESMSKLDYFHNSSYFLSKRDIMQCIDKLFTKVKQLRLKKGTVLYLAGQSADSSYIVLNGGIKLLAKKTSKQKLQNFANHVHRTNVQKYNFLYKQYGIQNHHAQQLLNQFYQDKLLFKYLPYKTIQRGQQFGIGQVYRNSIRPFTAIAITDTELVVINKELFDESLRQFQQKKQLSLTQKILENFQESLAEQLKSKLPQMYMTANLKILQKDDILYKQKSQFNSIYFIFEGQLEVTKAIPLQMPKKMIKNQNKIMSKKQIQAKVAKISKRCFVGQVQFFFNKPFRQFTLKCTMNETVVLEIEAALFQKIISENIFAQQQLVSIAHSRYTMALQSYEKQKIKTQKKFVSQYEELQNNKKQKLFASCLQEEVQIKNQFFEIFNQNGLFYRDTFQKLQGFNFNALPQNQKGSPIKRRQIVVAGKKQIQNNLPELVSIEAKQKILFSPKGNFNASDAFIKKQKDPNIKKRSKSHKKLNSQFQQLKKDEDIFKKVQIKFGIYPIDKKTCKSNSVKPMINYQFDEVVKNCITRKNPAIKKYVGEKRQSLLKEGFQRALTNIKSRASSVSKFSQITTPCKGAQQLRKKLEQFKNIRKMTASAPQNFYNEPLEECIGFNQVPKSQQTLYRSHYKNVKQTKKMPQKIVMLNHMMKPITYNSTQL